MKLKESPFEVETISKDSIDDAAQKRAAKRMSAIVANADEYNLYQYAPNRARNQIDRPGMPCDDYGDD